MSTLMAEIADLLLTQSQGSKYLTHNEALIVLTAYRQVLSQTETDPPAAPATGDAYIVAGTATGAWAGHEDEIAYFFQGGWRFLPPLANVIVGVVDSSAYVEYAAEGSPAGWEVLTIGTGINVFTGLTDTPNSYSGQSGKVVKVASGEDALEFGDAGSGDVSAAANIAGNAVVRGDGGAKGVKTSPVIIDDAGRIRGYMGDVKPVSDASYTFLAEDMGRPIAFSYAGEIALTVPEDLLGGWCVTCYLTHADGDATLSPSGGAALHNADGHNRVTGQWSAFFLQCLQNSGGSSAVVVLGGRTSAAP